MPCELDLHRMAIFFFLIQVALFGTVRNTEQTVRGKNMLCFAQPVTLRCTMVCLLSSSRLYSSTGEQCGFILFHFQMHKLNLKLELLDAAFPGLQSEPV